MNIELFSTNGKKSTVRCVLYFSPSRNLLEMFSFEDTRRKVKFEKDGVKKKGINFALNVSMYI